MACEYGLGGRTGPQGIGGRCRMKAIDLLFEHREQPAEGGVFVVPGLEQVGHGIVPVQPIGSSSISPDAVFEIGM